ncbi:Titin [Takifugu flavidus]|uniref:Titin n=1 Tax=Takifugu flavidus TaxID=433684 RepID=A0A5C6P6X8_9TELE|nr:Titin [Takifugu flavidus]
MDGGSPITGYHLERKEKNSILWTKLNKLIITDARFKTSGLEEGIEYEFRVFAENIAGLSSPSKASESYVARDPCDPPGKPETVIITKDSVTLQWSKPRHDGGSTITGYVVEKKELPDGRWMKANFTNIIENQFTVTGLTGGQGYEFRVTAKNGAGVWSTPSESVTLIAQDVIEAPTAFIDPKFKMMVIAQAASSVTGDSVVLTWERPETDGGSEIDGYILEKRDKEGVRWTKCNRRRLNDLRFRCTGLSEGHYYQFRVMAENAAGVGPPSEPSEYVKVCEAVYPPGPPVNFKVTDYSPSTVSLTWSRPIYDGGAAINAFILEMKEASEEEWITCSSSIGIEDTNYTVNRLRENTEHNFRLSAINAAGVGENVGLLRNVVTAEKLEAPEIELDGTLRKIVNVRSCSTLRLVVSVKGRPQPEVKWSKEDGMLSERAQIEVTDSYTVLMIENVKRDDTGKYVLTAENCSGSKSAFINVRVLDSPSAPTNLQYPFKPPDQPNNIRIVNASKSFIMIAWSMPDNDGGSPIIGYHVECKDQSSILWTKLNKIPVIDTQFKVANVDEGLVYEFRVCAENMAGIGPCSKASEAVAARDQCDPPRNLAVTNITTSSVSLSWDRPEYDGGAKITGYIVECKEIPNGCWLKCNFTTLLDTFLDVTGLTEDEQYDFRVTAKNAAELLSAPSETTGPVTVQHDVESPKITMEDKFRQVVVVKAGDLLRIDADIYEKCTLSWGPPHETGGAEILHYIVEKCETSRVSWIVMYSDMMATTCKISKLLKGNEYLFRVRAVNKYGEGETLESEAVKATDPFTVPSAPTDVEVTSATSDTMTICWKRPETDGGSRISGYIIEKREKQGVRWVRVNKKLVYDQRAKASCLREGCEYEFRVFAENSAGLSEPSLPCPLTLAEDPKFLPSPPSKLSITDSSRSSITLSWNKPLFDGGAAVTGYKIEYRKSTEEEWNVGVHNTDKTEFTVTGLSSGTQYVFTVRSINKIGISEPSPESDPQVAMEREEEPRFDITADTRKTLLVKAGSSFTLTMPFTGKPVPSVTWEKADVDLRVRGMINTSSSVTSITLEGATRDDSGKYTVKLQNIAGSTCLTLNVRVLDSPGPPTHLTVKDVTKISATVSWDIPENEGGDPVKNYLVDIHDIRKKGWTRLTDKCRRLSYKVSDLEEGGIYFFRITAENEYGIGVPAETKEGTKMTDFDDDGTLDCGDLKNLVNCLTGETTDTQLTEDEMKQLIKNILEESDIDKDGTVNLSEFQHVISRSPDFVSSFKIVL